MSETPKDVIEDIFEKVSGANKNDSLELFKDDKTGDIALKTDLNPSEHTLVVCMITENKLIKEDLEDFDLYGDFLNEFRRHKVSLDRKSRDEFVQVNMKNTMDRDLNRVANLNNLTDTRK